MPRNPSPQRSSRGKTKPAGVLRAATDELGITTPEATERPRRKPPIRVKVYKGQQR